MSTARKQFSAMRTLAVPLLYTLFGNLLSPASEIRYHHKDTMNRRILLNIGGSL